VFNLATRDISEVVKPNRYKTIFIHNTVTYFANYLRSVCESLVILTDANLVIMKQDEHVEPIEFDSIFERFHPKAVFTCVSLDQVAKVYPKSIKKGIRFVHTLTGYLTQDLIDMTPEPIPKPKP